MELDWLHSEASSPRCPRESLDGCFSFWMTGRQGRAKACWRSERKDSGWEISKDEVRKIRMRIERTTVLGSDRVLLLTSPLPSTGRTSWLLRNFPAWVSRLSVRAV